MAEPLRPPHGAYATIAGAFFGGLAAVAALSRRPPPNNPLELAASCAARVLLCAMTSAGRWSCSIVQAMVAVLPGAGGAEHGLELVAALDALRELGDRLRLVSRRLVRVVCLEIGH